MGSTADSTGAYASFWCSPGAYIWAHGYLFYGIVAFAALVGPLKLAAKQLERRLGIDWWDNRRAAQTIFRDILNNGRQPPLFGDEWVKNVAALVQVRHTALIGVTVATIVPTGYVALFLLGVPTGLSMFGFTLEKATLFQVALLAMCLLGVHVARIIVLVGQSEQLLETWLEHKHKADPGGLPFERLAYDLSLVGAPEFFDPPSNLKRVATRLGRSMANSAMFLVEKAAFTIGIVVFLFQVAGIGWAWVTWAGPAACCLKSPYDSTCIAKPELFWPLLVFVTAITAANFLIVALYWLPRPYRNPR
jgi:hypothetical protein